MPHDLCLVPINQGIGDQRERATAIRFLSPKWSSTERRLYPDLSGKKNAFRERYDGENYLGLEVANSYTIFHWSFI